MIPVPEWRMIPGGLRFRSCVVLVLVDESHCWAGNATCKVGRKFGPVSRSSQMGKASLLSSPTMVGAVSDEGVTCPAVVAVDVTKAFNCILATLGKARRSRKHPEQCSLMGDEQSKLYVAVYNQVIKYIVLKLISLAE